mmetsp:Transcript_5907/g.4892  ORF Transcript_5907/g.4892 Transcript_5907/m.4892 type:complete len:86 (+) Transcript_5907:140-397(+)
MLQSTDPSAPCHKCPVPINSTSAAICRSLKSDQCGLIDDILPMKWDTLSGVKVKVPSNPEALLMFNSCYIIIFIKYILTMTLHNS